MSRKPPDDLNQWSRKELVREISRLRAITREVSERVGDDPREASTSDPIIGGAPDEFGTALVDARSAVLLEGIDVVLIDTKREQPVSMMLTLEGRINYADDRVTHAYLFGPDGAAGLVTQLVGLATRAGTKPDAPHGVHFAQEFQRDMNRRLKEL